MPNHTVDVTEDRLDGEPAAQRPGSASAGVISSTTKSDPGPTTSPLLSQSSSILQGVPRSTGHPLWTDDQTSAANGLLRYFLPPNATLIVYGPAGKPYRYEGKRAS